MRHSKALKLMVVGLFISTAALATQDNDEPSTTMPMMKQGGNAMMNPQMMQQMMTPEHRQMMQQMMTPEHRQMMQQVPRMGYGHAMPMMGHGMGNMMMNPQMMHQMPHMGYGQGPGFSMPMMGQGMGNMMNPQMMQMRMHHMQKMEQHMANIESLLAQILEAQKSE